MSLINVAISFPFNAAFKPLILLAATFDFFKAENASVPALAPRPNSNKQINYQL